MADPDPGPVTIVTQTRVNPGQEDAFARWQDGIGRAIASYPGFIDQKVMPPSPPTQVDWVILQRFESTAAAVDWLRSDQRLKLLQTAEPLLAGGDDIHILKDGGAGVMPSPASAVISTRVRPGQEAAYRQWEQRIAAAQSRAKGFEGYRIEPPVPGVQDDWLAIVRFDSETNLQSWLQSDERAALLKETGPFIDNFHARIVRTGFDQWFPKTAGDAARVPAWKQNMLVLLMLYPVVFLFGTYIQRPYLIDALKLPFWLALFIGNAVSVLLLNYLVPWGGNRFTWWLQPARGASPRIHLLGAAVVALLYGVCLLIFSQL